MEDYLKVKGKVFNIQRFSTDDGNGIRTCVFLKGCPLKCKWCHNIESQSFKTEIAYYPQICIGCGECINSCPNNCLKMIDGKISINRTDCIACGECTETCSAQALVKIGEEMTCQEAIKTVKRDKLFFGENGGITITGGEPMAQFEFTYALALAARKENISFMLETSGCGKTKDFVKLVPLCDCFLFDCKASTEKHKELTGVTDDLILKNLDAICKNGGTVILRCPIVAGGNLDNDFINKIVGLANKHDKIQKVELMPYHNLGISKAEQIGFGKQIEYKTPSIDELKEIVRHIEISSSLKVLVL